MKLDRRNFMGVSAAMLAAGTGPFSPAAGEA